MFVCFALAVVVSFRSSRDNDCCVFYFGNSNVNIFNNSRINIIWLPFSYWYLTSYAKSDTVKQELVLCVKLYIDILLPTSTTDNSNRYYTRQLLLEMLMVSRRVCASVFSKMASLSGHENPPKTGLLQACRDCVHLAYLVYMYKHWQSIL